MLLFWNRNICEFKSFELLHHMIMYHVFCATRYVFPINVIYHLFVARHRFHSYIKSIIINYIEQIWPNISWNISQCFLRWSMLSSNKATFDLPSESINFVALIFTISIKSKRLLIDLRKNCLSYLLFLIEQFNRLIVHNDKKMIIIIEPCESMHLFLEKRRNIFGSIK